MNVARIHVAIVGAGFSGTMLAVNLMRHGHMRVTIIERARDVGTGVAYSTAWDEHRLNVRTANMSVFADAPAHFADWLGAKGLSDSGLNDSGLNDSGLGGPDGFAPRRVYGDYLRDVLDDAVRASGGRLTVVAGDAVDARLSGVGLGGAGVRVELGDGRTVEADMLALATGNAPPGIPRGFVGFGPDLFTNDPWNGRIAEDLGPGDTVLLLGTGLTMIDAALALAASGFAGSMIAASRRGLVPHAHAARHEAPAPAPDVRGLSAAALTGRVRGHAATYGWRAAVDSLRPATQAIWAASPIGERRRFLRHLRPWWDVHRHRIAPAVAAKIDALRDAGVLRVMAAKVVGAVEVGGGETGGGAVVDLRPRGTERIERVRVRRIINCTGPRTDVGAGGRALLRSLSAQGAIGGDALDLGIAVDGAGHAIGADGGAQRNIVVVGPLARGALWEIVAVPDIRTSVAAMAERLAGGRDGAGGGAEGGASRLRAASHRG